MAALRDGGTPALCARRNCSARSRFELNGGEVLAAARHAGVRA
ncbi:MAG: hypothetical protein U1F68_13325 [Gammaproteobacteria bacterium]